MTQMKRHNIQDRHGTMTPSTKLLRWTASLLLAVCFALVLTPIAIAQDEGTLSSSGPSLNVVAVDDLTFPIVSASLDARGTNGLPLAGLTSADFSVLEEGNEADIISVEVATDHGLNLLLALDRSTSDENWANIQQSVEAAIDSLRPEDRLSITLINDDVELLQEFTSDHAFAKLILSQVETGGDFSALNPAMLDAVNRAEALNAPRAAVIVVADVPDNISQVSIEDVLDGVSERGVPIYTIGVDPRLADSADLEAVARATGGQFFDLGSVAPLESSLLSLVSDLQQEYRVDFLSNRAADGNQHQFIVQLLTAEGTAEALGEYVARASELTVELAALVQGQPVADVVDLTVVIQSSAPIATIEYRVDGELVGSALTPNEAVPWDTSSVEPGEHIIEVTVIDRAGNSGEASVTVAVAPSTMRLNILGVDSERFPQMVAFLDAFGANGLPLVGLTNPNFTVNEDGEAVGADAIQSQVDMTQPLSLVLVLDRSLPIAEWAQVRTAVNDFVDSLRDSDQMAVYSFADSVRLDQPPTSDKNTLRSAVAAIQPETPAEGPANALYQSLLDAVNLADTMPGQRHAVISVTNSEDDTGELRLDQVADALVANGTPVHLVGFGPEIEEKGRLAGLARLSGGSTTMVNGAPGVRNSLQTLSALLQPSYRLEYQSNVQADDDEHDLVLGVVAQNTGATANDFFTARSGDVLVTIPNLADGDTVGGAINLTAEATAPAPIVSVVYKINGDVLAEVEDISFGVIWNSDTVEPGPYVLDVTATDSAGNSGSVAVDFNVVSPLVVSAALAASDSDGAVEVGDEITVGADVEALADTVLAEFYFDRVLVGSDNRPPYDMTIDTSPFAAGPHVITVVARDDEGREALSTLDLPLVAPPTPTPAPVPTAEATSSVSFLSSLDWGRWLRSAGILILLLATLAVFWVLGSSIKRSRNSQRNTPMRLALTNLGNVATGYLLRGEDPAGALSFQFSVNGVALGRPPVFREGSAPVPEAAAVAAATGAQAVQPGAAQGQAADMADASQEGQGGGLSMPTSLGDIGGQVDEAGTMARALADMLTMVAYFLPRGLSTPVRRLAMQIRRGSMMARRVKMVRQRFDRLNKTAMGSKLVKGATAGAAELGQQAGTLATSEAAAGAGQSVSQSASRATAAARSGSNSAAAKLYGLTAVTARQISQQAYNLTGANGQAVGGGGSQWVYVSRMRPGETLSVDVLVGAAKRPRKTEHFPFRILSRPLEEEDAKPVVEEGTIQIIGQTWWRRNLWWIASLALVAIIALSAWIYFAP